MANSPRDPETIDDVDAGRDRASPPPVPRWVKAFLIVLIALALIVVSHAAGLAGPDLHGPGLHLPGHATGDHAAPADATDSMVHQP